MAMAGPCPLLRPGLSLLNICYVAGVKGVAGVSFCMIPGQGGAYQGLIASVMMSADWGRGWRIGRDWKWSLVSPKNEDFQCETGWPACLGSPRTQVLALKVSSPRNLSTSVLGILG